MPTFWWITSTFQDKCPSHFPDCSYTPDLLSTTGAFENNRKGERTIKRKRKKKGELEKYRAGERWFEEKDVERRDEQWRPALWFIPCNFLPHYLPLGFQHSITFICVFHLSLALSWISLLLPLYIRTSWTNSEWHLRVTTRMKSRFVFTAQCDASLGETGYAITRTLILSIMKRLNWLVISNE